MKQIVVRSLGLNVVAAILRALGILAQKVDRMGALASPHRGAVEAGLGNGQGRLRNLDLGEIGVPGGFELGPRAFGELGKLGSAVPLLDDRNAVLLLDEAHERTGHRVRFRGVLAEEIEREEGVSGGRSLRSSIARDHSAGVSASSSGDAATATPSMRPGLARIPFQVPAMWNGPGANDPATTWASSCPSTGCG